ncbi:DUF349 domain-containing protein [Actinotalea sp. M2MS4P-6]|uniref:DUF349 domain-containing protein n=1 Tax=Actinotalea sp. M2MS4P-6 TaxID=2983762 RepID=UPI0021E3CE6B|nr:DUF349 domain-containing protein [Actinotalea sp. M2MS4P-6]MCV2394538.1 DUF349 domain-containing protein [Actinotalea sp. M2MS4P-6]
MSENRPEVDPVAVDPETAPAPEPAPPTGEPTAPAEAESLPAAADTEASADDSAPAQAVEDASSTADAAPADVATPQEEAPATDETENASPGETVPEPAPEATATDEATSADEATPADEAAPADEATPADEAAPADEAIATGEATPADEVTPVEEAAAPAEESGAATAQAAPAPRPKPVPRPKPAPRPGPRPTPAAVAAAAPAAPSVPAPPDLTPAEEAEAATFGRVDPDGTVYVREAAGERVVGQYPDADATEALALYVRRFADLRAKVLLFEARLGTDLPAKEIDTTLEHLAEELAEPAAVGDLDDLRARLDALRSVAAERKAAAEAERAAAKAAAVEARTALVEAAEQIVATDPAKIQWRPAGEQLRALLDQWKDAQRNGPRIDRPTEDALWKRFSHARSAFDRERRRFFSELEKSNAAAKETKAAIVAEAESLSTSTDWGATSSAYRDLMTRWKAAGRAGRKDDDALWARFRAAQDEFFAARDAANRATDTEYQANLEVKLELLGRAEKLVPVTDLAAAKSTLREVQEKWEQAGKVPRSEIQRVEGRLRAVEQAVRDAESAHWKRTNPETRARAEGLGAQLQAAIAQLEDDLEAAKAAKDSRRIKEATEALAARRAWLEQVERAAAESR